LRPAAFLAAAATVVLLAAGTSRAEDAASATKVAAGPLSVPLAAPVALPPTTPAPIAAAPKCNALADQARLDRPLPRTAIRLAGGQPIKIVAIGSSSTYGAGASSPAASYPSQLQIELGKHFPGQEFTVLNRGVNGEEAVDMLTRFETQVIAEQPHLVLWQVGTNSVLRDRPLDARGTLLHEGIERLKAIRADIVLIDPQFAPKVIAKPEIEDMVDLISSAAAQENVDVFHRFALMRHWHDIDGMPFEAFLSPDGLHMNDWSYNCFAKALADAIADAATPRESSNASGNAPTGETR
jgi:lysophospholipase L1-like esterase